MIRKIDKHICLKYAPFILVFIGLFCIFYFSWIESPSLAYNKYVPMFVSSWADQEANYNIRTAVPLIIVGFCCGVILVLKKIKRHLWFYTWVILVFLVFMAELGQLLLPLRSFDIGDVIWGGIGAGLGLIILIIGKFLSKKIK